MKFDESYEFLMDMYDDSYFPNRLVDKVKKELKKVVAALEAGEKEPDKVQKHFDAMTIAVNNLQAEFEEADSEIETVARDTIATDVIYILEWFGIDLDVEDALRERDW